MGEIYTRRGSVNSPNVIEPGVTVDPVRACAVMSPAGGKPDALSDAGFSSGAVASSSHSFACAEDGGLTAVLSALLPATIRSPIASN